MTLIERLRDPLSSDNWLTDRRDAADEIERSHKELDQKAAHIAKLENEIERLQKIQTGLHQECDQLAGECERLRADKTKWVMKCGIADAEIERLKKRNALLEDVAVAAEQHTQAIEEGFAAVVRPDIARMQLNRALDKLREVGDG